MNNKTMNSYVADELAYKNQYLSKALNQANDIIKILEQENARLKDVLTGLASVNNKNLDKLIEAHDEKFCTV